MKEIPPLAGCPLPLPGPRAANTGMEKKGNVAEILLIYAKIRKFAR